MMKKMRSLTQKNKRTSTILYNIKTNPNYWLDAKQKIAVSINENYRMWRNWKKTLSSEIYMGKLNFKNCN